MVVSASPHDHFADAAASAAIVSAFGRIVQVAGEIIHPVIGIDVLDEPRELRATADRVEIRIPLRYARQIRPA
jgi:hypothetical protein